jgi:hypothetical protein
MVGLTTPPVSNRIVALLRCSLRLTGLATPAKDAAPMPAANFTKVRVGILAGAHRFRAGSRIRVSVEAPGGDRRIWGFETPETVGRNRLRLPRVLA